MKFHRDFSPAHRVCMKRAQGSAWENNNNNNKKKKAAEPAIIRIMPVVRQTNRYRKM